MGTVPRGSGLCVGAASACSLCSGSLSPALMLQTLRRGVASELEGRQVITVKAEAQGGREGDSRRGGVQNGETAPWFSQRVTWTQAGFGTHVLESHLNSLGRHSPNVIVRGAAPPLGGP